MNIMDKHSTLKNKGETVGKRVNGFAFLLPFVAGGCLGATGFALNNSVSTTDMILAIAGASQDEGEAESNQNPNGIDFVNPAILPPHVNNDASGTNGSLPAIRTLVSRPTTNSGFSHVSVIDQLGIYSDKLPGSHIHYVNGMPDGTDHATQVAMVITGSAGICPHVDIWFQRHDQQNAFFNSLDTNSERTIANSSFGLDPAEIANFGKYNELDWKYDKAAADDDYVFVNSSGNEGMASAYITSPAVSLNSITVGSTDFDSHVSSFSSYRLHSSMEGMALKPTLVAPGENIEFSYYPVGTYYSGTSFAAPSVTGAVSFLSGYTVQVRTRPEFAQSLLLNSATPINGTEDIWEPYSGGGMLNIAAARTMIQSNYYELFESSSVTNNSTVWTKSGGITVAPGKRVDLVLCHKYVPGSSYSSGGNSGLTATPCTAYSIVATRTGFSKEFTNVGNVSYGTLYNTTSSNLTYNISVVARSANTEGSSTQRFALTWLPADHSHHYTDHYTPFSTTNHRAYCGCGTSVLQLHAFGTPYFSGGSLKAQCTQCGYVIDYGTTPIPHD